MRDKPYSRLAHFLLQAILVAILLPTAAQSVLAFGFVASVLGLSSWAVLRGTWVRELSPELGEVWRLLFKGLCVLWAFHLLSMLCESFQVESLHEWTTMFVMHLRLCLKQGVYGTAIILCMLVMAQRARTSSSPMLSPKALLLAISMLTLYMIGQRYQGWDWVHGWHARLGEHRFAYGVYRASGFMGHPLSLAFNAMLLSVLAASQGLWSWKYERRQGIVWFLVSFLMLFQIFLTGSRFPLAITCALLMVLFSLWAFSHRQEQPIRMRYVILGLLGVASLTFALDPNLRGRSLELFNSQQNFEENFDRIIFWKVNLCLALDHLGVGSGLLRYPSVLLDYYQQAGYTNYERKYAAHNIFLQTAADMGLLGLTGLTVFLVILFSVGIQVWKRWCHAGVIMLALATVTSGLMQNNLRDSEFLFALWAGIGLTLSWLVEQGMASEPTESRTNFENHKP